MDIPKSNKLSLIDDRSRHSELLNRLNKLRISKAFCDVTVFAENKEFVAHKVILASSSDYFLSKFTEDPKCDRLSINMNKDIFNLLLDYFYTSNLIVSKEKVPQLFSAAKYLKVRRVVKVCGQFLTKILSLDNIIDVRESVALNDSEDLCQAADAFIKENMDKIISNVKILKLNMDIMDLLKRELENKEAVSKILDTVPKKENDSRLAELVIDWLEYSIVEDNMKLSDFVNENLVFFLTPSNSLVQCSEMVSSNKFSSTFINDYFNGFLSYQKNISKRVKCRPRSKERPSKNSNNPNKTKHQVMDNPDKLEKDVIMIQSDEPSPEEWKYKDDNKKLDESFSKRSDGSSRNSRFSSFDGNNDLENFVDGDLDCNIDDDIISNSIKSKTSAKPEHESCVISVNSTEIIENEIVRLKIKFLAKIDGKVACISLHVKSVLEIINQGFQDSENSTDMALLYGQHKQSRSTAYGSESTSGLSSSSVSAASSLLHVDLISNMDDTFTKHEGPITDSKSDDQSTVLQQLFKKVNTKVSTLERFDCLSTSRCAAGLVNVNDQLIVIGGFNRGECLNSVEIYQPLINKWSPSLSMKLCRARLVALVGQSDKENPYVYAIGGSDGYKELHTVERFDVNNQRWSRVANINQQRSYHGGAVMPIGASSAGNLAIVGGCFGPNNLRSCEIYDTTLDKWSDLKSMSTSRSQAAIASIDNQLFVVGGTDSWKCLSSCEVMDLREGKWRTMPEPSYPRRGASLVPYNGKLYLFGGSDSNSSLRTLEIFDSVANQWSLSVQQMKQSRANLCGGVLLNKLMAIGGFTGKHFLDTMECVDFDESCEISSEWSMYVPIGWSVNGHSFIENHTEDFNPDSQNTITSGTNNELLKQARLLDALEIQ